MLDRAIQIAVRMHAGKSNKTGEPAVFHSLRVMMSLESEIERVCGVLAGSAGRPGCTLKDLAEEGFGEDVLSALQCLSKRLGETYDAWIARLLENETACRVRLAVLADEIDRLGMTKKSREFNMLKEASMDKKKLTSRALQAKETKKRIINSGKKLIQSEGFDHVSVNEISKNAGITVGTFYYYFNSKDELLYEMMPKMKDYFKSKEAQQMKEESSFAQLMSYFSYLIHYPFGEYKDVMKHILASEAATAFIDSDRIPDIESILSEGQGRGEFEQTMPPVYMARLLFYANRGVFKHWLYYPEDYEYSEAAYQTVSRLAYTFLTEKGKQTAGAAYR